MGMMFVSLTQMLDLQSYLFVSGPADSFCVAFVWQKFCTVYRLLGIYIRNDLKNPKHDPDVHRVMENAI